MIYIYIYEVHTFSNRRHSVCNLVASIPATAVSTIEIVKIDKLEKKGSNAIIFLSVNLRYFAIPVFSNNRGVFLSKCVENASGKLDSNPSQKE